MSNKKRLINYTNRDFNKIKDDLLEHAKIYYPENYRDFSSNSFGSFILDAVSQVGDMLSFYTDYQVNESFLETALDYDNVRRLAKNSGYKFVGRPTAFGTVDFYVMIPASDTGQGENKALLPLLKKGSLFSTSNGLTFTLIEDVDFSYKNNLKVPARMTQNGNPSSFAIKATGEVKSSVLYSTNIDVGEFKKFRKVRLGPSRISAIQSVIDSEGHEYYEVGHLSQDVVYINTTNPNLESDGVPHIMKSKIVPRRFVLEQDSTGTYLQFGYGTDEEIKTTDILDPSQISLKMTGRNYITDSAFDPSELLTTNTLGVVPANTTLTVVYEINERDAVNVGAGQLINVVRPIVEFPRRTSASRPSEASVIASMELSNNEPISIESLPPTTEEIRYLSYASNFSQMRSVTRNDYEAQIYMMPPNFGRVKRASVINDPSSTNRRLSIYVTSADSSGNLLKTNMTTKNNIKTWLNKNKMLNDNIDIYDATIANIGFDFEIVVHPSKSKTQVLNTVFEKLRIYLKDKMYIGESFSLTNVMNIINKTDGVLDTTRIKAKMISGTGYANPPIGITDVLSLDGTYLKAPRNVIFEIKNIDTDIMGTAV